MTNYVYGAGLDKCVGMGAEVNGGEKEEREVPAGRSQGGTSKHSTRSSTSRHLFGAMPPFSRIWQDMQGGGLKVDSTHSARKPPMRGGERRSKEGMCACD